MFILAKRCIILIAVIVCLFNVAIADDEVNTEKDVEVEKEEEPVKDEAIVIKKFCPAPTGFAAGPCPYVCKTDDNCRGEQKCCPTRCGGTTCTNGVTTAPVVAEETTSSTSTKEGTCPGPYYTKDDCGLTSIATCVRDSQCLGSQKCCDNGCVHTCRRPEATKNGTCPSGGSTTCNRKACIADSDCPGNLKCCHDGCRCSLPNSRTNPVTSALSGLQARINSTLTALPGRINSTLGGNLPTLGQNLPTLGQNLPSFG